jgi:hypothetical protein
MTDTTTIPYARTVPAPTDRRRAVTLGLVSCTAGFVANAIPAYLILCMLKIPAGTAIRPMLEASTIFLGALGGLAVGLPLAIACIIQGRRWWLGWCLGLVGCALACSPWFVGGALWDWVVARQGFIMKP